MVRVVVRAAATCVTKSSKARQTHWDRYAHNSNDSVHILHSMDTAYGQWLFIYHVTLLTEHYQPFVDDGHPLHSLFPPRVWAIRIPVILILLGSAAVGSFLSMVMIRSNRKKAAKAKAAAASKKKA